MPEHNTGQMGGTMRLGRRRTIFTKDCVLSKTCLIQNLILKNQKNKFRYFPKEKLYGNLEAVDERHRHRYEVNPIYVKDLEKNGMQFVGQSEDGNRMEIMELKSHPYFVGVQYHPEYLSRPSKPSAPYVGLILATCSKLKSHLNNLSKQNSADQLNDSLQIKSMKVFCDFFSNFFFYFKLFVVWCFSEDIFT